jgi:hypothetical protein
VGPPTHTQDKQTILCCSHVRWRRPAHDRTYWKFHDRNRRLGTRVLHLLVCTPSQPFAVADRLGIDDGNHNVEIRATVLVVQLCTCKDSSATTTLVVAFLRVYVWVVDCSRISENGCNTHAPAVSPLSQWQTLRPLDRPPLISLPCSDIPPHRHTPSLGVGVIWPSHCSVLACSPQARHREHSVSGSWGPASARRPRLRVFDICN